MKVDYATVAYWYGAPGATSGLPPVPNAAERALPRLTTPPVFVAEQALEGEELAVAACSGGHHEVQDLGLFESTFSRDRHRFWRGGKVGDELVLTVPVAAAGRYRVVAAFVMADDFAQVALTLGGTTLGAPFDGYSPTIRSSGVRVLGELALPAGPTELRLRLVGSHAAAKPGLAVGLDYLLLEPLR